MKLIIAGNKQEYLHWLRTNNLEQVDHHYVADAQMLRGLDQVSGRFVGSFRHRPDILHILEHLMTMRLKDGQSHTKILQLYKSILKERGQ